MTKIAFVAYRQWAYDIYEKLLAFQTERPSFVVPVLITTPEHEFVLPTEGEGMPAVRVIAGKDQEAMKAILEEFDIDAVCFYGWSWLVKEPMLTDYTCLCLHPSPLPRYRGGSPIQNQIVAGEAMSAVSVIKMSEGIDDGDIYKQIPMSLEGTLDEILGRIVDLGVVITRDFVTDLDNGEVVFTPQHDLEANPALKRRTPEMSELTLESASSMSFFDLNNFVRALTDPYPNVFLKLGETTMLVQAVQKYTVLPEGATVLTSASENAPEGDLFLEIADGYARIARFKFI